MRMFTIQNEKTILYLHTKFFPLTAIIKSTTAQFRGNLEYLSTINTCVGFNSWWCKVCLWRLVHRVSTPCLMPLNHPLPKPAFPSTSQIHLPHLYQTRLVVWTWLWIIIKLQLIPHNRCVFLDLLMTHVETISLSHSLS